MRLQALRAQGLLAATRLYLIRHGRVAEGHADRYHGHNDIGLSPLGVKQLDDLAAQLAPVDLAAVFASDLSRSLAGAAALCRGRDLTPHPVPELREINFGVWEGLSFEEIAQHYPKELEARFRDLVNFRIPGGESLKEVHARALPALRKILEAHAGKAVALVGHAGVNRVILSEALGLPLNHLFRLDQNHGCLNIIDYFQDLPVVRLINGGVNGGQM